jgi:hypothetical protein
LPVAPQTVQSHGGPKSVEDDAFVAGQCHSDAAMCRATWPQGPPCHAAASRSPTLVLGATRWWRCGGTRGTWRCGGTRRCGGTWRCGGTRCRCAQWARKKADLPGCRKRASRRRSSQGSAIPALQHAMPKGAVDAPWHAVRSGHRPLRSWQCSRPRPHGSALTAARSRQRRHIRERGCRRL